MMTLYNCLKAFVWSLFWGGLSYFYSFYVCELTVLAQGFWLVQKTQLVFFPLKKKNNKQSDKNKQQKKQKRTKKKTTLAVRPLAETETPDAALGMHRPWRRESMPQWLWDT